MKTWKILMGILLACVLVMPTPAPMPSVDVDANWTAGVKDLGDTVDYSAVSFDNGGRAHMGIAFSDGVVWHLNYVNELLSGDFSIVNGPSGPSLLGEEHVVGPAGAVSTGGTQYMSYLYTDSSLVMSQLWLSYSDDGVTWHQSIIVPSFLATTGDDSWTAIALDSSENVHIIYKNPVTGVLTHAWYNEPAWENDPIAPNAGPVPSVAATPGGGLLVSYFDTATTSLRVIAYDPSGGWDVAGATDIFSTPIPITQHAIAVDSAGYGRLLFVAQLSDLDGEKLYLAEQDAGGWSTGPAIDGSTIATQFRGVDLAMDGTTVHGAYSMIEGGLNTLRYVTGSSGTLETSALAAPADTPPYNYYFAYPGISYDGEKPVIGSCFFNNESNSLLYVLRPVFNPTFTAEPSSGEAPLTVTVTATSPLVTPSSVAWDFGNGDTGTGMTDTTVYDGPGSYTITMSATSETASVIREQTITVTAPPMGDDSTLPEPESQRASSTEGGPGNMTWATFNFTSEPVKAIEILGYVVPEDTVASVLSLNGPPDDTVPSGQVWRYLEMSLAGITKTDVLGAYIRFRIPEQVILSSGYTTEDVALVHLTEDGWELLPTILEKKEGAYVYYRAYTPGFSYFAIIFDEKATIRDLPELEQVIEENVSGNDEQTVEPEATPTGKDANVTATPEVTPTEPTATPIPSVTVPVPETTPTQSPAPLATLIGGLAACGVWAAWRRK
ncbi:hypothetical protein AZH53_08715 [Methanomicrobiaceae archaeon CYW5]|uniref:PGF-pre-PGF domain-containing protein n=1 Tax=Methanovulcanius yangii TaxID=1789227 RepID=UPI0029CA4CC1|nr:PGF-pre-PGF domain-containing protein [Methanovulcanius yangii]MBT8508486.1 hypothetical protein [Methanovulcanius yangii]